MFSLPKLLVAVHRKLLRRAQAVVVVVVVVFRWSARFLYPCFFNSNFADAISQAEIGCSGAFGGGWNKSALDMKKKNFATQPCNYGIYHSSKMVSDPNLDFFFLFKTDAVAMGCSGACDGGWNSSALVLQFFFFAS